MIIKAQEQKKKYRKMLKHCKEQFFYVFMHHNRDEGITTVLLYDEVTPDNCNIYVGQAYLSSEDSYNKNIGGALAIERALMSLHTTNNNMTPKLNKYSATLIGRCRDFNAFDYLEAIGVL